MNAAMNVAGERAASCFARYAVPDLTNVAPTLTRSRIACGELGANAAARAHNVVRGAGLFSWVAAPRVRAYGIDIDTGPGSSLDERDVHNLAVGLVHEALHFSSNNTNLHHTGGASSLIAQREWTKLFTDRIFFLDGLCGPEEWRGKAFWRSDSRKEGSSAGLEPLQVPGALACEDALTNVAPDAATGSVENDAALPGRHMIVAKPLKPAAVRLVCDRVAEDAERKLSILPAYQAVVRRGSTSTAERRAHAASNSGR